MRSIFKLALIAEATSKEMLAARVSELNDWSSQKQRIELDYAWEKYDSHPNRARPATINIYQRYQSYFNDFVKWAKTRNIVFLDEVDDNVVSAYADHLKSLQIGVDTHNKRITRVAHVFNTLSDYMAPETSDWGNPSFKRRDREENGMEARRMPFSKEQEEAIFAVLENDNDKRRNKAELRVLFYLGAYTGQRMKDCALLQWHSTDLNRRRINVKQFKTGKEATIPIAPQLLDVLMKAWEWKRNSYVLPDLSRRYQKKNNQGKDVGSALVNLDVLRVIKAAGISTNQKVPGRKRAVTVYGFHSLRHAFVSFCAERGVSKAVVVSILGADSKIIGKYYTHIGDEAQEQAISLLSGSGTTIAQRLQRVLDFINGLENKSHEIKKIMSILET